MAGVVPHRFLFRYAIPVQADEQLPRRKARLIGLGEEFALPDLGALEGVSPFASVRLAWNARGLGVTVVVQGKQQPVAYRPGVPELSDGVALWIDTRPTQNVHRATRYCHQFWLQARGGGPKQAEPLAAAVPIARARENPPERSTAGEVLVAGEVVKGGYWLDAWLPAEMLHGFDPDSNPRLGFSYLVQDQELGEQGLTVGAEFPVSYDPSLWSTLELKR